MHYERSQNHPLLPTRPRAVLGGGARAHHTNERAAVRSRSLALGGGPPLAGRVGGFGLVLLELRRPRTRDAQSARPAQGIGYHGIVSHHPQPDLYRRNRRPGGLGFLVAFPANPAHASHLFRCFVPVRHLLRRIAPAQNLRRGVRGILQVRAEVDPETEENKMTALKTIFFVLLVPAGVAVG